MTARPPTLSRVWQTQPRPLGIGGRIWRYLYGTPQHWVRVVMDRVFEMMSTDPDMGPKLRDAETPQRFEFPDLDLVVNITSRDEVADGQNLVWEWSDDVDWDPDVKMTMVF